MSKIYSIEWLDVSSYEAEVTLVDSQNKKLVCFSFSYPIDIIQEKLSTILGYVDSEIVLSEDRIYILSQLEDFNYYVVGKVLDKTIPIIKCFDYILKLDVPLPGDIQEGDWVEFSVERFNIYE